MTKYDMKYRKIGIINLHAIYFNIPPLKNWQAFSDKKRIEIIVNLYPILNILGEVCL